MIHFDSPWALVALAAVLIPSGAAARIWWRGGRVRWLSTAIQTLAVAAVAIALAGPRAPVRSQAAGAWLVMTDASASVRGQGESPIAWDHALARSDYTFAAGVYAGAQPPGEQDTMSTRASAALAVAAAQVRQGQAGGVVIRTDGRFDATDPWPGAASALAAAGANILIVPMDSPPPDARVLSATAQTDAAGAVDLNISIASNAPQRRRLRVLRRAGGSESILLDRQLDLLMDDRTTIRVGDQTRGEAVQYAAQLTPPDAISENDQASALVLPRQQTLAVVAADPKPLVQLIGPIKGADVAAIRAAALPARAEELLNYSAMVIADDSGLSLTDVQRAAVAGYVRGGGGLVLIGSGPRRGPGDLADPLNTALPLVANAFQRKPLDLRIVLDASGSMNMVTAAPDGGRQIKFDQAAQAVVSLDRYLTAADALEIIAFSDVPRRIYSSGAAAIDFAAVRQALNQVRPDGATKVAPALAMAADAPAGDRTALVMLVSDLDTQPFDVKALAETFGRNTLDLAIVAIAAAGAVDQRYPVEDLAAALKAPLVRRGDLQGLAEIFGRFVSDARGDAVRRGQFSAEFSGGALGVPGASMPLDAYVLSAAAGGAEVLARVGSDPIVARRGTGQGRSVSIAVPPEDLRGPWWAWAKDSALLPAALRWVMRPESDSRFSGNVALADSRLRLTIDARDQNGPMNLLTLTGVVQSLSSSAEARAELLQTAPGRYEATLPAMTQASLQVRDESGTLRWQKALAWQYPPELAAVGADSATLKRLAELTGGQIVDAQFVAPHARAVAMGSLTPLWPWLLGLALAMMLTDWVAVRR